ncbi:HAMP domain-containing sensor histidine kinase [Streptomyces sp. NPDC001941]|uniref:sensor histidine kinase n=1 Tax=Streptomyces sp. NPDC001941 TaxID=3154659 RepID=UPI00332332E8
MGAEAGPGPRPAARFGARSGAKPGPRPGATPVGKPGSGPGARGGARAGRPAADRLRRTRWTLTLLYAAVSAACLVTLVVVAAAIDTRSASRSRDAQVTGRAQALSRAVWMDGGVLHLEPLSEDVLANASDVTAVLRRDGAGPVEVRWVRPARDALPSAAGLDELWESTVRTQETVLATEPGADGRKRRWATAPVWGADDIGAVVLTAADPGPDERNHAELLRWLVAGCAVLTLAAAGVGHLLSGRSMRPALRALDQQEQFLAEAAHELRTPLASLRLAVEGGGAGMPSADPGALRLVDHLDRLVAGLLARAHIEAGSRRPELTPLRLDQLVEQVVDELPHDAGPHDAGPHGELPHGGAAVTLHTEPTVVLGDPDLLAQAVRNLVENAVRHGSPAEGTAGDGGAACAEVRVAAGRVSVRNHGPGIPPAERERVFGDRVGGGKGGIGVGLAIVRWVAELHGGTAEAGEAPGGGALVELVLPPYSPS